MYCVYLTIYLGNKMPPFYIGSSSIEKLTNGYHGSVSSKKWKDIWDQELKSNPHLFKTKIVCSHNTRQEAFCKEYKLQKALNIMKKSEMYINMSVAAKNGYFGMDMNGANNHFYGKIHKIETKQLMSTKQKGENSFYFGKSLNSETKRKISRSHIESGVFKGSKHPMYGKPSANRGKKFQWITNNVVNKQISIDDIIPNGWHKGSTQKRS